MIPCSYRAFQTQYIKYILLDEHGKLLQFFQRHLRQVSLLFDSKGVLVWQDQANNYLNRTRTSRVLEALQEFC